MHGRMKTTAVAALLVFTAAGCTRRVVVESEPNRYEGVAAPAIDITGSYDYTAEVDGEAVPGRIDITRSGGGYAVTMTSAMGAVETSNVRRDGNRLTMDANTPGGAATVELTWTDRDHFAGIGLLGGRAHDITGIRRP